LVSPLLLECFSVPMPYQPWSLRSQKSSTLQPTCTLHHRWIVLQQPHSQMRYPKFTLITTQKVSLEALNSLKVQPTHSELSPHLSVTFAVILSIPSLGFLSLVGSPLSFLGELHFLRLIIEQELVHQLAPARSSHYY
jgi:hypothetical protein